VRHRLGNRLSNAICKWTGYVNKAMPIRLSESVAVAEPEFRSFL